MFDTDNQCDDTPFTFEPSEQDLDEQFEQYLASYNFRKYQEELLQEIEQYMQYIIDQMKPA